MNNVIGNGRTASGPDHRSLREAPNGLLNGLPNHAEIIRTARVALLADLSASISHHVNDSLSAIILDGETSLALLNRDDIELERVRNVARRMMSTARKASENVRRINALASNGISERAPMNINNIAAEAVAIVQGKFDLEMISFSSRLADNLPHVWGDQIQFQQLVLNMLVNSIQAILNERGPRREIELTTQQRDGNLVLVTVRDSGETIAPREHENTPDWFSATGTDRARIGIAVCRLIAIAHGGTFSEYARPEGGTESVLAIPSENRVLTAKA